MKRERSLDDLIETLKNNKKCTLLIGAGCSVKAGIPTAAGGDRDYSATSSR